MTVVITETGTTMVIMTKDMEERVLPLQETLEMAPMSTRVTDCRRKTSVATATNDDDVAKDTTKGKRTTPDRKCVSPPIEKEAMLPRDTNVRDLMIGIDPRNLPEIKGLKATKLPDPYKGADDIAVFEGWVQSLLSWFRLARMTGQKADTSRLDVMQLCLKGPARENDSEVDLPNGGACHA
ncbi:hypothetical protein BV22DRAFT_1134928 [Leucogyrophana mollusca]|uniref:Uncharacterized protein n=1 Tax=Leucogyrophana mollusca TaxID=85980 RepID=A0ACB8AXA2_9AGAM|nr:hypothetical protein BV22DRAFT_1134928 [Leucogyrophana mollusca]